MTLCSSSRKSAITLSLINYNYCSRTLETFPLAVFSNAKRLLMGICCCNCWEFLRTEDLIRHHTAETNDTHITFHVSDTRELHLHVNAHTEYQLSCLESSIILLICLCQSRNGGETMISHISHCEI